MADDVILCASELAANSAIHSRSRLPGGIFTVRATISPGNYAWVEIEDSGQHEVLNWFCLLGAMEELGRNPDRATFIETWAFVSPVVFAHYYP